MLKRSKYILITVCILTIGGWIFSGIGDFLDIRSVSEVFAKATNIISGDSDQLTGGETEAQLKFVQMTETFLKALYLMMRPLLAIAGASLDNSLVYGEVFYLDTMLWKFWQMIRNFANFAIGLIFIGSILAAFFYQNSEKLNLKKIFTNTFIAGILINMSRWVTAVVLDLATVGVITIGALPLSVVAQDPDPENKDPLAEVYFLKQHMVYNLDGSKEVELDKIEHSILYSCAGEGRKDQEGITNTVYFIPCVQKDGEFLPNGPTQEQETWQAYKASVINSWKEVNEGDITISDNYCVRGMDLLGAGKADEINSPTLGSSTGRPVGKLTSKQIDAKRKTGLPLMKKQQCSTLDNLVKGAEGLTGPLYNLFAVVLHMGENALSPNNQSLVEASLQFFIKLVIGLALVVPLLALAVVLVIRAVILWLVIAFSPFLLMMYVYEFKLGSIGEKAGLSSMLGLIFMPVIAVFAISMSLIFLSLISRIDLIKEVDSCTEDTMSILGARVYCPDGTENTKCYDFYGITELCFSEPAQKTGGNIIYTLAWLVSNFFGIAMMWMIVFAALKTIKITEGVVGSIESLGKGLMTNVPIVPIPGMGNVSLGSLGRLQDKVARVPDQMAQKGYENSGLADTINSLAADFDGGSDQSNAQIKKIIDSGDAGQAKNFLKNFNAEANTDLKDYQDIEKIIALAGGDNKWKDVTSMKQVFKNKDVMKNLIEDKQLDGLADKLIKSHGNTQGGRLKQEFFNDMRAGLTSGDIGKEIVKKKQRTSGGSMSLYKSSGVTGAYIQELFDNQGRSQGMKQINLAGIKKDKADADAMKELVDEFGIDNIPDEITEVTGVVEELKAVQNNGDGKGKFILSEDGSFSIVAELDDTGANVVGIDKIDVIKKDASKNKNSGD